VALWALRHAPQRLLDDALVELADQRAILDKLLLRNHAAARGENAAVARQVKAEKRTLIEEAQDVIAAAAAASSPAPQLRQVKPASEEAQLIELRKKAGIL
jgi:hypothetical protein